MEQKENSFSYTYSASQQQEIESIRKKYLSHGEDKMTELRRLHNSATRKAQSAAITLGVIGALILGTGMSLAMTEIGQMLGMTGGVAMLVGIAVGLVGMVLVALAYPVYNRVLSRQRQRIAPQILSLTEELLHPGGNE